MSRHTIDRYRFFALFGALAAAIGCLADVLLLYNPQGGYELGFDEVLRRINNPFRSMLGGLLGVFVLPFMLLGCWALRQVLAKAWKPSRKKHKAARGSSITTSVKGTVRW